MKHLTLHDVLAREHDRLLERAFAPRLNRRDALAAWIRAPHYTILQTIGTALAVGMAASWWL